MKWWRKTPKILSNDYEMIYGINNDVTKSEVEFLISETSIPTYSNILDLCCGTGRHSIKLAQLGYQVTGLDISSDFLKIAKENSKISRLPIVWINQDMRYIPFKNTFNLVFIMFGAWGFFKEDHENFVVFQAINHALKMNGHFILDYFNRDWILNHFQPRHWIERESGYYLEKRQFDYNFGRLNTESIFIKQDGSIKKWETSLRAFTLEEIKSMLKQAGFIIHSVYGNLNKQPYDLNTPRMLLHAIKTSRRK
jgi:SAM-dependent methyltransferase